MTKTITPPNWYLIFLIHSFILLSSLTNLVKAGIEKKCIESERQSLLSFKNGIIDPHNNNNKVGSWGDNEEEECCNWSGIECNNITHHIISLNLRGYSSNSSLLTGNIDFSSLINLTQLTHLDLSYNDFNNVPIPAFIGYLTNLNHLNLSNNWFVGSIHFHVANLSKLSVLDLGHNSDLVVNNNDLGWLSNLSSLKYLDLSFVQFSDGDSDYWATAIHKLPLLHTLFLSDCGLPQPKLISYTNSSPFLSHLDLSFNHDLNSSIYPWLFTFTHSLVHLNLASNDFHGPIPHQLKNMVSLSFLDLSHNQFQGFIPDSLFKNMASLSYLDLSSNQFQGSIPNDIGNLTSLVHLDLGSNNFVAVSPKFFENLCNLKTLSLFENNMEGMLSDFLNSLSNCARNSLQYLDLASNKLIGSLPNFTMFPYLKRLDLSNNALNGTIPQNLGQLYDLEYLCLGPNSLEGEVSEAHFSNLTKLRDLNLSGNSLVLKFNTDWVPPFQLDAIFLRSCKLGPLFPNWLQTQNFTFLDISHTQISDTIPHWFWTNLSLDLMFLDISWNKIKGEIPDLTINLDLYFVSIFLNSNEFVGQVPPFLLKSKVLNLSNNKFSSVTLLCEISHDFIHLLVDVLNLSNNQLSGQLPDCWDQMSSLRILSLANNSFFGEIPRSMGNLTNLEYLHLRNNKLYGEWPHWFNSTQLQVFDIMGNNLSGILPSSIGSQFPNLIRLNLKSNTLGGKLPSSICKLKHIQILDISSNNIIGTIPPCLTNLHALTNRFQSSEIFLRYDYNIGPATSNSITFDINEDMVMTWKGSDQFIMGKVLPLQKSIDLSSNQLTGHIPNQITTLVGLINLNLSSNNLTGRIPDKMGQLQSLESLDLSRNRLYGPIPSGLSQISRLSMLNLSYNNLSGKIPTGTQLQSFHASSYEGNFYLCGDPLQKCSQEQVKDPIPVENRDEDGFIIRELLISMAAGFVVGFWGIFGSLILNRKWRHAYFNFMANIIDIVTCN